MVIHKVFVLSENIRKRNFVVAFCLFFAVHTIAHADPVAAPSAFSTLKGLGFDKWASIWLVERRITPNTPVTILEGGNPPDGTAFFDEPNTQFMRDGDQSTYAKLATYFNLHSPFLDYFAATVHDIEIRLWQPDQQMDSRAVESAYRALQDRWGRENVPRACYGEFFDRLEQLYLKEKSLARVQELLPQLSCWKQTLAQELQNKEVLVTQMPISTLVGHLRSGARVAYVDVREPDEFAENHIPGAVNLTITDANAQSVKQFADYDIVVAYCIKDFRGFEMARKLRDLGIHQSVILNPFGIRGWIASKLPVYKAGAITEEQAKRSLQDCIDDLACQPALPKP